MKKYYIKAPITKKMGYSNTISLSYYLRFLVLWEMIILSSRVAGTSPRSTAGSNPGPL